MWKALKSANVNISAPEGSCLIYAREVFGIAAKYPTAWQAWENAQYKHTDQSFPSVPVLVFFSGAGGDGHVEVYVPGQGFYGSPYNTPTGHIMCATIAQVEQHYGVKFAGWAEDVDGVRVAEQVADPAPAPAPSSKMPAVGSSIQLVPTQTRTTYRAGTATVAGHINVTNNEYVYVVRGYDSKYPGRILINSASAGGNGVGLALFYTNGQNIGGWKVV